MLRFEETKIAKEMFYAETKQQQKKQQHCKNCKKTVKSWNVNVNNIVISKIIKVKTNSKYLIGYLDKAIGPLVLIMPKMSGYVKIFKVKDGDQDKNNKLMSFRIDNEQLLEQYKAIWTNVEDFCNIGLNPLPVYDDRYIKTKIIAYEDKVYTAFHGLNVPKDDIECESFTIISIDSVLLYEDKYYLQDYLDNSAYKITNKKMIDYFDDNLFED